MTIQRTAFLAVLIILVGGGMLLLRDRGVQRFWGTTGLICISDEERERSQVPNVHISILVDGMAEVVPEGIGVDETCTAEIHTRDQSGYVYLATDRKDMRFKLRDLFAVWDRPLERPGYEFRLTVNGTENSSGGELVLKDGQDILLSYLSPSYEAASSTNQDSFEDDAGSTESLQFE